LFAVMAVALGTAIRLATADGTDADPKTGGVVVISGLRVPVERQLTEFSIGDVTVWQGSDGPMARFDTSGLGSDRSFSPGQPSPEALVGLSGDVIYLGEFDGRSLIVFGGEAPARNPWDYVYEFVMGHGDRRLLDATFPCCTGTGGDPDIVRDWPWTEAVNAQWLETPAATSVVAFEVDGRAIGFQRPVGRIVNLPVSATLPYLVTFTAYGASGTVLVSHDLEVVPYRPPPDADDP